MHRRLSIKDESVICGSRGFTVAKVGKRVDRRGGGGGCSSVLERVRAKELQRKVEAGVRRGDEGHEGDGGCLSRRVDEVKGRVEAILREERARGSVLSERKLLQRVVDSYDGGIEEELVKKAVDAVRWRGADGRRCAGIKDVKDTTNIKDINGSEDIKDGKDVKDTTNIKDINGSEDIKDGKDVKDINGSTGSIGR
ncbi:uncharacterized protein C5L36_0C00670 [Pichia kudriavzevii]|uniref:Uncharacterized protein n=1 Tax=Pichia kudriavzevii TaxID=4909 RepID=A0A2U9R4A9_PICKU|nr:uncharacterized protein C5L36_0C00670 [Pichia kudriavzevii]AWU76123.1 hypothetical protein C5L36_0C00670 [Pichia kudriavzevii]